MSFGMHGVRGCTVQEDLGCTTVSYRSTLHFLHLTEKGETAINFAFEVMDYIHQCNSTPLTAVCLRQRGAKSQANLPYNR